MTDRPCTKALATLSDLPLTPLNLASSANNMGLIGRPLACEGTRRAMPLINKRLLTRLSMSVMMSVSLAACQPPSEQAANETAVADSQKEKGKVIVTADTVMITTDHILNIKSKRYQPSLGLQGTMFAINAATLASPTAAIVQEVLVNQGQVVKKDTPLMTLQVVANEEPTAADPTADTAITAKNESAGLDSAKDSSAAVAEKDSQETAANAIADNKTTNTATAAVTNPTANATATSNTRKGQPTPPAAVKTTPQAQVYQLGQQLTIKAPFFGNIDLLNIKVGQRILPEQPLLKLSDPNDLQFIATLPINAKSQLSVGQNVTFSVTDLKGTFTGQVSQLIPSSNPQHLLVHVHIIEHDEMHRQLKPGMSVLGRVDYGQIEVGTIVPKSGIHNADLTSLLTPPYRAMTPIKAEVWIIGQDQRLSRQQIQVIEYDPETQQYLVAGINNDSLICLAPLPADSEGKKVVVS